MYRRADGGITEVSYKQGTDWFGNRKTQVETHRYGSEQQYQVANTDWRMTAAKVGLVILGKLVMDAFDEATLDEAETSLGE